MATTDSPKVFRSTKPEARLAEIKAAISAAEVERADHIAQRPAAIIGRMTGDPDAAARVATIDQALAGLDRTLRDLREADREIHRRREADEAAALKRAAEARPRRLAELRRERLRLMQTVTEAMETAAAAIQASQRNGDAIAAELGNDPARGQFLTSGAFQQRLQAAFALAFAVDPAKPLDERNSLLGLKSREIGERTHWSAAKHEEAGMDAIAPFFLGEAEAEAARERLAARGSHVILVPLAGGVFTLVRAAHVFGDQVAADEAARANTARRWPTVVLAHQGGFVLVPERFVSGEAA